MQAAHWFIPRVTRNTEVNHRRKRKMAPHGCSYSALLLIICSVSVFIVTDSQDTTLSGGHHAAAVEDNPQAATEAAEKTSGQPAVEERRWEATEVEEATLHEAAADKQDTPAPETEAPSPVPQPKDDFQEELVIRPLHSGDIYASFQFRTLWETDFMSGNKGKLTVSTDLIWVRNTPSNVIIQTLHLNEGDDCSVHGSSVMVFKWIFRFWTGSLL